MAGPSKKVDVSGGGGGGGAQGPQGDPGPQGPAGPYLPIEIEPDEPFVIPGPKGDAGTAGGTGPQGVQGTPGPPLYETPDENEPWMIPGPRGDIGLTGSQGIQGVAGTPGPPLYNDLPDEPEPWMVPGPTGATGATGPPGSPGTGGGSATVPSEPWEPDWEPIVPVDPPLIQQTPVYVYDNVLFRVPDNALQFQLSRLALTVRGDLRGTGRLQLGDSDESSVVRFKAPGSITINTDEFVMEYQRVAFYGNARKTILGTGRAIVTGFVPVSRLVLSGRGGGS